MVNSLELRSASASSAAGTALQQVVVTVATGSIHALLGENNSGCSEVLAVMAGYLPVTGGTLLVNGETVQLNSPTDAAAQAIAVIRGEPATVPQMSVADNVFLGIERARGWLVRRDRVLRDAVSLLERLGLQLNPTTELRELSMGERRVVQLARELARGTRFLLLDGILAGLVGHDLWIVESALRLLAIEGVTIVLATQRLSEIRRLASAVTVFSRGRSVGSYPVDATLSESSLVRDLTAGIAPIERPGREPLSPAGEALRVLDWSVWHPVDLNRLVIDSASFVVHRGEIVALAGLEGSRRSELALSLFGRSYGSRAQGAIWVADEPVVAKNPQESISAGLGLATDTSVRYDLNLLGGIPTRVSPAALARLARLGVIDPDRDYRTEAPLPGLGSLASTGRATRGMRIIETLTLWLSIRPKVIILDLPTEGTGVQDAAEIRNLIMQLAALGTGVLLISNDLHEILTVSDRVYAVIDGRVGASMYTRQASPETLMTEMLGLNES